MKIAEVEITHPDKVLFPDKGLTKQDIVNYYRKISEKMLPYLKDRPLTLQRFPDGIDKDGFYQKNAADYFPDYIKRVQIKTSEGINEQLICNDLKTLLYLVNQGTITFHIWLSRKDRLHRPDKVVFDLDPPEDSFSNVKKAVGIVKNFLLKENKDPKLMTTGKNGFHVWYTQRRTKDFDQVREDAKAMANKMVDAHPDLLTTEVRKDKRNGKIFVDYLRNAYGQTSVCPYSLRPVKEASIATPIEFNKLSSLKSPREFAIDHH